MLFHFNQDIQIASESATDSCFPFAFQLESISRVHSRRNFHLELALLLDSSRAAADPARIFQDLAAAGALRTGPGNRYKALTVAHLTMTIANRTSRLSCSGLRATAAAKIAAIHSRDRNLFFRTLDGFFQRDFHTLLQI